MAPETARLIEEIDSNRQRISRLLEEMDKRLREADAASAALTREVAAQDEETEDAKKILRRAGLLPA
jgi:hypothetical protein